MDSVRTIPQLKQALLDYSIGANSECYISPEEALLLLTEINSIPY